MPDPFRHVIAVLWRRLGLSRPSFQRDDAVALTVDSIAVKLALTEDGRHIILSVNAGTLSGNPVVRDQQVTRLLKTNIHTLLSSRVCACLDNKEPQTPMMMVRAAVPCETAFVDSIAEAISDVAHLAGEHRRDLDHELGRKPGGSRNRDPSLESRGGAALLHAQPNEGLSDDMLLFRL